MGRRVSTVEQSLAAYIAQDKRRTRDFLSSLTPKQAEVLAFEWEFWARPKQLLPASVWETLVVCAGRGFGKTRMGAEAVRKWAKVPETRIALVGRTLDDVRHTMVEGESGILAVSAPYDRPLWQPGNKRLLWPNGSIAQCFSSEKPDQLRGPQFHKGWGDEAAAWKFLEPTWDNLQFGLRLGDLPQCLLTTTPRPLLWLIELLKQPGTLLVEGSTRENAANLAGSFISSLIRAYGGTDVEAQEMEGKILSATDGALWNMTLIAGCLVNSIPVKVRRAVVAVDPSGSDGIDNDETGIVVVVLGSDGLAYVVEDLSGRFPPDTWGVIVCEAAQRWNAEVVVETNCGGDMARNTISAAARMLGTNPIIHKVRAKENKRVRAEPASTLYVARRVKHVGAMPKLEQQLITYVPGVSKRSPDRLDALVYALTHLFFAELVTIQNKKGR